MDSQVGDLPDQKRQKMETLEPMSPSSSEDSFDEEDVRKFEEEHKKHGDYDFDASKVGRYMFLCPVKFEESEYAEEPETDGQLMERLSQLAIDKYNHDKSAKFKLFRAVKANWNLGGGHIFSITLEAKEEDSQPITFHAKVKFTADELRRVMDYIHNMSVIGLLPMSTMESQPLLTLWWLLLVLLHAQEVAGDVRMTDTRADEAKRGITISSQLVFSKLDLIIYTEKP